MSPKVSVDQSAAHQELDAARQELLDAISALADGALALARRGGWSVQRVLQHVIEGEWHYVRLAGQLCGQPVTPPAEGRNALTSVPEAVRMLVASRQALLAAIEDIDEASFYQLSTVGREEYSVLSVLENAAHHDREHAQQIRSIMAGG